MTTTRVGNIDVVVSSLPHATADILARARRGESAHIHFVNAWSVVLADRHEDLAETFAHGTCFPDGRPVVWTMRRTGAPDAHQVRGPSLFESVIDAGRPDGIRHYLLGSTEETLAALREAISSKFPGAVIAGASSPPFRDLDDNDIAREIALIDAAAPDVLWVGLGTPKQDHFARRLRARRPGLYLCVGAAFDFTAGTVAPAPEWMTKAGLEWLHRLLSEPRRLWRRYLVGNTLFILIALRQHLQGRRARNR